MEVIQDPVRSGSPVAADRTPQRLHIGVVAAGHEIVAIFADRTARGLLLRISEWVAERAERMLWQPAARRVTKLLESGEKAAAVKLYFEQTGQRWDPEQLHRDVIELE